MSTDVTRIIKLEGLIKENNYKIDKIRQENEEIKRELKSICTHPTYTTKAVEDEYGRTLGYTKQCNLCGEYLEK